MKWLALDPYTEATEIVGSGCVLRFYGRDVCFVPNVSIEIVDGTARLKPYSCIQFSLPETAGTSTTTVKWHEWQGNAGDKLEAKLTRLSRKQAASDGPQVTVTPLGTPAKVDMKKFKKLFRKQTGKKAVTKRVR